MKRRNSPGSRAAGPAGRPIPAIVIAVCGSIAIAGVGAALAAPNGISVSGQWFRLIMPSLPAAGYFTVSNGTGTPQTLVGAQSPACGTLMLHQSVSKNGEERMITVPSIPVPAHGSIRFAPSGYHLMCMSPGPAMTPGQSVPVTFRLANGETVSATFPVRGATGK